MKNIKKNSIAMICLLLVCTSLTLCLTGCKKSDKPVNNSGTQAYTDVYGNKYDPPTDNDEEGWFSTEVLAEYSVMSFTLPENTTVTRKPSRDFLYLEGDKNTFATCANYAFKAIYSVNDGVYLPVYKVGDDGIAKVASLNKLDKFSTKTLYPYTNEMSVCFIYKSVRKILECTITLESITDDVYRVSVKFSDRTAEYAYLK